MALYVPFVLLRADERELEYAFGVSDAELDRRLLLHVLTGDHLVRDGRDDHAVSALLAKVHRLRRERGEWPRGGAVQS